MNHHTCMITATQFTFFTITTLLSPQLPSYPRPLKYWAPAGNDRPMTGSCEQPWPQLHRPLQLPPLQLPAHPRALQLPPLRLPPLQLPKPLHSLRGQGPKAEQVGVRMVVCHNTALPCIALPCIALLCLSACRGVCSGVPVAYGCSSSHTTIRLR